MCVVERQLVSGEMFPTLRFGKRCLWNSFSRFMCMTAFLTVVVMVIKWSGMYGPRQDGSDVPHIQRDVILTSPFAATVSSVEVGKTPWCYIGLVIPLVIILNLYLSIYI